MNEKDQTKISGLNAYETLALYGDIETAPEFFYGSDDEKLSILYGAWD